jgi:hypothetical protein
MATEVLVALIGVLGVVLAAVIPFVLKRIEQANARIDDLFYYTMSEPMYQNLKKLAEGRFQTYEKPAGSGLERELYHLRDIGFVEITGKSGHAIRSIPERGDNLQDHVRVTEVGRSFVRRRSQLDATKGARS